MPKATFDRFDGGLLLARPSSVAPANSLARLINMDVQPGGWWYLGQLRRLFDECIAPHIAAGNLEPVSASEWSYRLGYGVGK